MKRTFLWSIALCLTAGMLSTALTSCSDDDDNGGSTTGIVGAWKYVEPSRESILVFLAEGKGIQVVVPNADFTPPSMPTSAPPRKGLAVGIVIEPFAYTLSADGTSGKIEVDGGGSTFEMKGKQLIFDFDGGMEFTRIDGTGNVDYIPYGIWYSPEYSFNYNILDKDAGMGYYKAEWQSRRLFCLPTGPNTGYLYELRKKYPTTYQINGKQMLLSNPDSKVQPKLVWADKTKLVGTWRGETAKATYTFTFDEENEGNSTRVMKSNGSKADFGFDYLVSGDTSGVVMLWDTGTHYYYTIDGNTMYVYEDEEMTKLTFELTKEE